MNICKPWWRIGALAAMLVISAATAAAELSAEDVMNKAFNVYGGDDSISTLTFSFEADDQPERKLVYTMLWKRYKGEGNVNSKFLFIKEFPAHGRGIAYMSWRYRPYVDQADDEWIYLPELRTVRKVSHRDNIEEDEEFAATELKPFDLDPRHPSRDSHTLTGTEEIDGVTYYVIESSRKDEAEFYPYRKVVRWISADRFLTTKIHYFDLDGNLRKQQTTEWQPVGDAWSWKALDVENVQNGHKTRLEVSDIRLNTGLSDDVFSQRTMKTGLRGKLR
ncbi:MAG: hypothetical protein FD165_1486 [Gammaproteobacteria bacterium]|nr:MAG: hypothetical protein FD165_1486 [Gammaproteobacteria bacterium]TND02503.1 MAG: hypothetical protein FD120_2244 [Gammaproteobacteria bacterium]